MHASSLLKSVLKPRNIPSSNAGQSVKANDSKGRGGRAASPDSILATVSVNKKGSASSPAPVKMSCLCAPTNHAGSFRCRLHRGTQHSWGGKPLAHSAPASSAPKPPTAPVKVVTTSASTTPAAVSVPVENRVAKRPMSHSPPGARHHPMSAYSPPLRSPDSRPSRLSKVSAAVDVESPKADGSTPPKPSPLSSIGNDPMRYSTHSNMGGRPNGAILDTGIIFAKKFHSNDGKSPVLREVLGSGGNGGLSRAGLSL